MISLKGDDGEFNCCFSAKLHAVRLFHGKTEQSCPRKNLPPLERILPDILAESLMAGERQKKNSRTPEPPKGREKIRGNMEKEYIISVVNTIKSQLIAGTDLDVLQSWGFQNPMATVFRDMPALAFFVNGRLFRGCVIIAYQPSDTYDIFLVTPSSERQIGEEIFADQLGDIIDRAVERGDNTEEYEKFCQSQLALLAREIVIL